MPVAIKSASKCLLILIGLCLLCAMPLAAQDDQYDAKSGYIEALRRIEEARIGGTKDLDLSAMRLEELPSEIGQLINLRRLKLTNNNLTMLPPEIVQLTNLLELFLDSNELATFPLEISQLTNLEYLYLSNNQLTSLPPEIEHLDHLIVFVVDYNHLTSLPPQIGNISGLSNLFVLSLSHNQLRTLPSEIGQLTHLYELNVRDNQLVSLPVELGYLHPTILSFSNNPITFPPLEIQRKDQPDMLAYLRDYHAMLVRQTIVAIAAGIGGIITLTLAFRWRQRRGLGEKKKRS